MVDEQWVNPYQWTELGAEVLGMAAAKLVKTRLLKSRRTSSGVTREWRFLGGVTDGRGDEAREWAVRFLDAGLLTVKTAVGYQWSGAALSDAGKALLVVWREHPFTIAEAPDPTSSTPDQTQYWLVDVTETTRWSVAVHRENLHVPVDTLPSALLGAVCSHAEQLVAARDPNAVRYETVHKADRTTVSRNI